MSDPVLVIRFEVVGWFFFFLLFIYLLAFLLDFFFSVQIETVNISVFCFWLASPVRYHAWFSFVLRYVLGRNK